MLLFCWGILQKRVWVILRMVGLRGVFVSLVGRLARDETNTLKSTWSTKISSVHPLQDTSTVGRLWRMFNNIIISLSPAHNQWSSRLFESDSGKFKVIPLYSSTTEQLDSKFPPACLKLSKNDSRSSLRD